MTDNLYWMVQWFKNQILAIPGRIIALVFVITLLFLPLITAQPYVLGILIFTAIFAIFAASWDLLSGFTGQFNLGHALFFGVGAYTIALLNKYFALPPVVTIPAGGICAVLVGLIAGLPVLRLRGFYLSLVTLSFPIILRGIIFAFPDFTGGELGLFGIDRLSGTRISDYYIVHVVMIISVLAMWKFTDARSKLIRVGVILHAIREDEITARASGISTTRYKLLAFATSGFFSGIAGGLYGHYVKVVGPSTIVLQFSFEAILWTIFGGIATIYGAIVGVYIIYPFILEGLRFFEFGDEFRFLLLSLILIFTILFMPQGIAIWVRDKIEVNCPRCKVVNMWARQKCRACRAPLHLESERPDMTQGDKP